MNTNNVPDKVKQYFEKNYMIVIPKDAEMKYECLENKCTDSDYDFSWDDIANMITKYHIDSWYGDKFYKIIYEIKWTINNFDPITTDCGGNKCRRKIGLSFYNWCTGCHGEPCDMSTKERVKVYIVGESNRRITFYKIQKYIKEVTIFSIKEIINNDTNKRADEIKNIIALKDSQLAELRQKLAEEEKKNLENYKNLGFNSSAELESFLAKNNMLHK